MISEFVPHSEFVPAGLDAASWGALRPLYRDLIDRPIKDASNLDRLLHDRSDLDAAAAEAGSILYINMTRRTDDPAANQAFLDHLENVQPKLKEAGFELDKKISLSPFAAELSDARYRILLRNMRTGVELFRPENVPIETELGRLDQEYSRICGAMTVNFRGQERTIPQMSPFQEDPDRPTREEAWRAVAARRLQDEVRISEIFDKMVALRHQIALNAGFQNYRDYMFKAKRRFEYTPEDCARFAEGVEKICVPALRRLGRERAAALKVAPLRPWDLFVDIKGRPALKPFQTADEMVERTSRLFHKMEPSLGAMFDSLRTGGCLDLETRKGKAPGGYQANRDWTRKPFIFMNAAGIQRDVETILHEAGHAFHALLSREDPLLAYRADIPHEFAEVASMGMELTSHDFLEEFYPAPSSPAPSGGGGRVGEAGGGVLGTPSLRDGSSIEPCRIGAPTPDAERRATQVPGPTGGGGRVPETGIGDTGAARARRVHLEQIAGLLPTVAMVDQFQHWIYTNPAHTREERRQEWVRLNRRFGADLDWSGLEHFLANSWHRILHLFGVPFYFIEYGIAQLGALQLWLNYRADPAKAIGDYKHALALGGSRSIPDLYGAANLKFDMGPDMIARLWQEVETELRRLPA